MFSIRRTFPISSRGLALAIAALLFASCGRNLDSEPDPGPSAGSTPYFVYVGTTTDDPTEGIHVLQFDPETGTLRTAGEVTPILNPSFLALAPDGGTLYAVSETEPGEVGAFRVDPVSGELTELNRRSSGGAGPAYVGVSADGRWVTVANYGGGSVALLPVEEDGSLADATDVVQHTGSGPDAERQEGPHAHYARPGPDGRWVWVADLGTDEVIAYPLDAGSGKLQAERAVRTRAAPGAGPRHIALHPDGPWVYVMNELAGVVTVYRRQDDTGRLTELQTASSLPAGFEGPNNSADIHVHPSGRWLYASNRGDFDSIAIFAIDPGSGRLTPVGHQREGIHWPRNFTIDPGGRWLLVANQRADEVRVFAVDAETGRLTPTDHRATVPSPTNVTLAPARG